MDYPVASQSAAPEKSCELYIRDYPHRSIAIVSSSHALILRYTASTSEAIANGTLTSVVASARPRAVGGESLVSKCMVEFAPVSKRLLQDYRRLTHRPIYGTLGLIAVNSDVFISVITHASRTATVRPGETVERIASVAFYCLSSADYDDVVPLEPVEPEFSDSSSVYTQSSAYSQGLSRRDVPIEQHPCHDLRNLLSNGSFYYSTDFDLTNRLQDRPINSNSFEIDNFDDVFLWNSFMISPLVQFRSRLMPQEREALDASRILTSAIRGFCKTMTIPQSASPIKNLKTGMPSYLTLISRLSCRRAGTRFNARGIDDDGHVANFVETETTFWSPSGTLFSYAQVRGSVPVFWEQAADLIPGRQKITVTRSPDGTQPAFDKHFDELEQTYGAVHIINLLSESKPGEVELSNLYRNGVRHCPLSRPGPDGSWDHALLRETHYDFHAETKGPGGYEAARDIRRYIEDSTDGFAYFLSEETNDLHEAPGVAGHNRLVVVLQQEGVFRTNCLDCLDRTNLIQTIISQMAVEAFLGHRGEFAASDFWMRHSSLWADNGDSLSRIYAGTGALKTSFTRHGKMSLAGAVADVRKSVQRIYHNNFVDPSRQITIDMLLGRLVGQAPVHLFDPISDFVSVELAKRSAEFSSTTSISMWVGTFNLNGRTEGVDHDLGPWLFPPSMGNAQPDIYVVGFQEIVELSPQQIMNSDPTRKQMWETAVKGNLNERQRRLGGDKYVLLRSGQLVGAALCIFVKTSALDNIKNVEGSVKKTGMSGMAGNKGAVAIRFDYANTHICFVTAHLAAGFANYDERNRDYATIHHGLRFQRNRSIDDHDAVVWLGDFNYRIGLSLDTAKALVKKREFGVLYENDQLNLQMVAGLSFPFYSEARITFPPTYKFDIGTDEYDTSEKARIPAWTDRILRKGPNLRQLLYDSAPLKFSDHRPVHALFECKVGMVNEGVRETISRELYQRRKAEVGDATAHMGLGEDTEDEDLIGYDSIEPGLPPASSDRQKWWLDNKQPARAAVPVPRDGNGQLMGLNPNRPSNPFGQSEEGDWISIPRSSSKASLSSMSSSPFEKVMLPHSMSSGALGMPPRKLPPPFDPSTLPAKVGRMALSDDHVPASRGETPPPPPPRRQTGNVTAPAAAPFGLNRTQTQPLPVPPPRPVSAASHNSHASYSTRGGKSPPPVAKKPAHLSTISPSASPRLNHGPLDDDDFRPPLPTRAATSGLTGTPSYGQMLTPARKPVAPPKPAMNGSGMKASGTAVGAVGLVGMVGGDARPVVAARRAPPPHAQAQAPAPVQQHARQKSSVDLLGSLDEGQDMGGWETLKPSTRT
ncbi:SacI homology domain-containing protein [Thelonectria olida]|uniref:phosphoinositide 5-phosphatase n=1 Tax=Thelonectria olida TaxID=1576542 RepID=A0A9P8WH56_9HYPO|nr:SacI homology domain-containing protein [Thelonectria olida]